MLNTGLIFILLILLIISILYAVSLRISIMALVYYIEKKGCIAPTSEDIRECTEWVVKKIFSK